MEKPGWRMFQLIEKLTSGPDCSRAYKRNANSTRPNINLPHPLRHTHSGWAVVCMISEFLNPIHETRCRRKVDTVQRQRAFGLRSCSHAKASVHSLRLPFFFRSLLFYQRSTHSPAQLAWEIVAVVVRESQMTFSRAWVRSAWFG